jgi:hypothetical protein
MKQSSWTSAYENAWSSFYRVENLKKILRNSIHNKYWGVLFNFFWFKNAVQVEGGHPMLHGFFRLKNRKERRNIFPLESRWQFAKRRFQDIQKMLIGGARLVLEMEDAWLATRSRNALEERVLLEIGRLQQKAVEWRDLRLSELQQYYQKAALALENTRNLKLVSKIQIPSRFALWLKKWNVFTDSLTHTRASMSRFWQEMRERLKQGKIYKIRIHEVVFMSVRECILFAKFIFSIFQQSRSFNHPRASR